MTPSRSIVTVLWLCLLACAHPVLAASAQHQQSDARPTHIRPTLLAEGPVAPGQTVTMAVLMQPEPGWHGYWTNPGDAGLPLSLDWSLPAGAEAGELRFPVPQTC